MIYHPGLGFKYAHLAIVWDFPEDKETIEGIDSDLVWNTSLCKVEDSGSVISLTSWKEPLLEELQWASIILVMGEESKAILGSDPRVRTDIEETIAEHAAILGGADAKHIELLSETPDTEDSAS